MNKIPKELDILKDKIWENLRGKINPRTRKKYTESEAWAIATARWKKSGKQLATPEVPEQEEPYNLVTNAIKSMERGEGQGVGNEKQGDGGTDYCYCPKCNHREEHKKGVPCNEKKCPHCGAILTGVKPSNQETKGSE